MDVYWAEDRRWYQGRVVAVDPKSYELLLMYDDGEERHEPLWDMRFKWLESELNDESRDGARGDSARGDSARGAGAGGDGAGGGGAGGDGARSTPGAGRSGEWRGRLFCSLCHEWVSVDSFSIAQARAGIEERRCLRHSGYGAPAVLDPKFSRKGEAEEDLFVDDEPEWRGARLPMKRLRKA